MYSKMSGRNLKQYHHVRLDAEFKFDCLTWIEFLKDDSVALQRPFVDFDKNTSTADELDYFTNTSKNPN